MNIPENNKYTNDQTILKMWHILSKHLPCYKLTKTVLSIIAQPNQSLPLPISLIIVQSHDKHFVLDLDTNPNFLRYRGNNLLISINKIISICRGFLYEILPFYS